MSVVVGCFVTRIEGLFCRTTCDGVWLRSPCRGFREKTGSRFKGKLSVVRWWKFCLFACP